MKDNIPINSRFCFRVINKIFIFPHILPLKVNGEYHEQRQWKQKVIQQFRLIGTKNKQLFKWIDVAWYEDKEDYKNTL
jgi:hypothetical protein